MANKNSKNVNVMAPKPLPKKVASKFSRKLEALPRGSCTCFDCLRDIGLTPPIWARDRHKRLYPPATMVEDGRGRFGPKDGIDARPDKVHKASSDDERLRPAVRGRLV